MTGAFRSDGRFPRRLDLFGIEEYLDDNLVERHARVDEEAHLLPTHAVLPLLVSERSAASFLCTDALRLLQRLTNSPCGDLGVLVVPAMRRCGLMSMGDIGHTKRHLAKLCSSCCVFCECWSSAESDTVVFRKSPNGPPFGGSMPDVARIVGWLASTMAGITWHYVLKFIITGV